MLRRQRRQRRSVTVVFYRVYRGVIYFLCQGRAQCMAHGGGELGFPGGFVETGETAEQVAVREVREETGVRIGEGDLRYLGRQGGHTDFACRFNPSWEQVPIKTDWELDKTRGVNAEWFGNSARKPIPHHQWFAEHEEIPDLWWCAGKTLTAFMNKY